jgi:hypothetical protein
MISPIINGKPNVITLINIENIFASFHKIQYLIFALLLAIYIVIVINLVTLLVDRN